MVAPTLALLKGGLDGALVSLMYGRFPCPTYGVRTRWSLRFLPTQTMLWSYDWFTSFMKQQPCLTYTSCFLLELYFLGFKNIHSLFWPRAVLEVSACPVLPAAVPKTEYVVLPTQPFNFSLSSFWVPWNMSSCSHLSTIARLRTLARRVCIIKYWV